MWWECYVTKGMSAVSAQVRQNTMSDSLHSFHVPGPLSGVYFFIYFSWFYYPHLLGSRHYCDSRAVQPKVEMWQQHSGQVRLDYGKLISCILKISELHLGISGDYSSELIISLKISPTTIISRSINCSVTFLFKFLFIPRRICSYNRHYAEHSGYWETTSFLQEVCRAMK